MRFAEKNNERILPNPMTKDVICPLCKQEVIAKCGSIKVWHWAHKNIEDCDTWADAETEWHINWKDKFPHENQETILEKCVSEYCNNNRNTTGKDGHAPCNHINCPDCIFEKHRADVLIKGLVIEFQNSPISSEDIIKREKFYDRMIWVLNKNTFGKHFNIMEYQTLYKFRWKWFPKSWLSSTKPIYIDYGGDMIFRIKQIYSNGRGWGKLISKKNFIEDCYYGYYGN